MKKNKLYFGVLVATLVAFAWMPQFSVSATEASEDSEETSEEVVEEELTGTMASGISINGVDVSGMSVEEVEEIIDAYLTEYDDVEFTFTVEDRSVTADAEDIGLTIKNDDVIERALNYGEEGNPLSRYKANADMANGATKDFALTLTPTTATLSDYLTVHTSDLVDEAEDNTVVHENGEFVFVEGKAGTALLVGESIVKISDYLATDWDGENTSIELLTCEDEPDGTEEELATIGDLLGSYNTDFSSSSSSRATNIELAASNINGTVLYPGETISVSDTIGPRTEENGFELAGAYENGETVEAYGGGVCQVSTTLYNAVLRAELEIVTRSAHSMVVSYVEPSMDAAIADGLKDLQFKNNQDTPIYIEMYVSGRTLYANIYGLETRDDGYSIEFVSEITSQTDPTLNFVEDATQAIGYYSTSTGHTGYTAKLWKVTYQDGVEVDRTVVNNSTYKSSATTITVGTLSADGNATLAVQTAIVNANASQSQDELVATIAAYTGASTTTQTQQSTTTETVTPSANGTTTGTTDTSTNSSAGSGTTTETTTEEVVEEEPVSSEDGSGDGSSQ